MVVPVFIAVAVALTSPNFQMTSNVPQPSTETERASEPSAIVVRDSPVGSDFLQEYVGGRIYGSGARSQLYQPEVFRAVQHDSQLLGFSWPKDESFPMVYPPFYYAAMSWISHLSDSAIGYLWAVRLWVLLSGLAVVASVLLLDRYFAPCRWMIGTATCLTLIYVPLLHNYNLAQKGSWLLLILSATFVLLHKKQHLAAGLVFGLIAFKPHLGLTIGITMLLKRHWWFCGGALLSVGVISGLSYWNDPCLWQDYVQVVTGMGSYVRNAGYELAESHSLWGAAQLSLGPLLNGLTSPATTAWIVNGTALIAALLVVAVLARVVAVRAETDSPQFSQQFAAMLIAMVMLSPHFYTYDLTVLLLAIWLLVCAFPSFENSHQPKATPETGQESASPQLIEDQQATSMELPETGWRATSHGRRLGYLLVGLFALSGVFPKLAAVTGIQLSIPCMLGVLWLLGQQQATPELDPSTAGPSGEGDSAN